MNEAQTRQNKIAPRLRDAGWSIGLTRGLLPLGFLKTSSH